MKKIVKSLRKNLFGIVFWVVILTVFLSVSSFLVIRASGYAYNFKTNKFQKTSLIYIRTVPSGAEVYLDNDIISKRTPLRISYLLPGYYSIKIVKDGYQTIDKNIKVLEGLVSEYRNLILIKEELDSSIIVKSEIEDFILSPGKTKIFFKDDQGFKIYDLRRQKLSDPISFPELDNIGSIEFLSWPINRYIKVRSNDQILLINISHNKTVNLSKYFPGLKKAEVVSNSRTIIKSSDDKLYEFNQDKLKEELIVENIGSFTTFGQNIYYLQEQTGSTKLFYINTFGKRELLSSPKLYVHSEIIISPDKQIVFHNAADRKLYYLDPENGSSVLKAISSSVSQAVWSKVRETYSFREKYKLLYSCGKEIWLFQKGAKNVNGDLEEKKIITRLDTTLQELDFFKYSNYCSYQTNNNLYLMDDEGQSFEIIKELKKSYDFDKDFKEIFYLNDSNNLVRAQIR